MAFEGDLSHLSLGDVLQTLAMSRQTGTFVIRGRGEERRLVFGPRGCGLLTVRQARREHVAVYLAGRGKLPAEGLAEVRRLARRRKDAAVDDLLIEKGLVTESDLADARRYVAAEDVYDLFLWTEGEFEFVSSDAPDHSPWGNVWFDVAGLSMEAARRMDEASHLRDSCPLTAVFRRQETAAASEAAKVGRDAAQVWEIVDGTRTVDGLLTHSQLGRFDTWKALDSLRHAGLVRHATPHEMTAAADELVHSKAWAAAIDMLRRVLDVRPDDAAARRSLIDALVASGEKKGAAGEWVLVASAAAAAGDTAGARDAYRQAVRCDNDCAAAHDGLARILFATDEAVAGAESVRTAVPIYIERGDPAAAADLANLAVQYRPEDAALRVCLANASIAAGDPAAGLLTLDEAASILEATGDDQRRLVDVYRRILQLDPTRKDCARRVEEIESSERFRRRRTVQRVAVAVGVVLVAMASIPVFGGPSFEVRIEAARLAIAENRLDEAATLLDALENGEEDEDRLTQIRVVRNLRDSRGPRALVDEATQRLSAALDGVADAAQAAAPRGWTAVLAEYSKGLDLLDGPDAKLMSGSELNRLNRLRKEFIDDLSASFQALRTEVTAHAAAVTGARERSTAELFKKEDAEALSDLVRRCDAVAAIRATQDWAETGRAIEAMRKRIAKTRDGSERKAAEAIQILVDGFPAVERDGARALAIVRKKGILESSRTALAKSRELMGEGRLTDANDVCRSFIALCDGLRTAEPRELYDPIVSDYVDGMGLEVPIRERLAEIEQIAAKERAAGEALARGDVDEAFGIRAALVREHKAVDFRTRFRLPVRILSRPAGAQVRAAGADGTDADLGRTPVARFEYGIDETVRITLELDGYESVTVERRGALEDLLGSVAAELPKRPDFTAQGAVNVHAGPVGAGRLAIVAGRDGRVRAFALSGDAAAPEPFETGSLAGVAGVPAVVGDRLLVATLDATGFVLDSKTFTRIRDLRFDGPVRGMLLPVPGGVAAATEGGSVLLLDGDGRTLWSKSSGRVSHDPVLAGHRVAVVNASNEVVAFDAATGGNEIRVRLPDDPRWGAPAASGDRVYVAGEGGHVACVDLAARRVVWTADAGSPVRARPALAAGRLLLATAQGILLSVSPEDGSVTARENLGAPMSLPPLSVGDGWVAATDRGTVVAFDRTGTILWRYDAKDTITSPLTLVSGRIAFCTRRGTFCVLRP